MVLMEPSMKQEVENHCDEDDGLDISYAEYFRLLHKEFGKSLVAMYKEDGRGVFDQKTMNSLRKKLLDPKYH